MGAAGGGWRIDAGGEGLMTGTAIGGLVGQLRAAEGGVRRLRGRPSGSLPSRRGMGGRRLRLSAPGGRASLPAASGESRGFLAVPPSVALSSRLGVAGSSRASRRRPRHSAGAAARGPRSRGGEPWSLAPRPGPSLGGSGGPRGVRGKSISCSPCAPCVQWGRDRGLGDRGRCCIWIWRRLALRGSGVTCRPGVLAPSQAASEGGGKDEVGR